MWSLFKKAKELVNPPLKLTSNFLIDMRGVIHQQNMTPQQYFEYLHKRPDKREEKEVVGGHHLHVVNDLSFLVSTKDITALLHHEGKVYDTGVQHYYSATLVDFEERQVLYYGSNRNEAEQKPVVKELDAETMVRVEKMRRGIAPQ